MFAEYKSASKIDRPVLEKNKTDERQSLFNMLERLSKAGSAAQTHKTVSHPDPQPSRNAVNSASIGPAKSIMLAMKEDKDPAHVLSEIRRLLLGPSQSVNEARIGELLQILDEFDQSIQASFGKLDRKFSEQWDRNNWLNSNVEKMSVEMKSFIDSLYAEMKKHEQQIAAQSDETIKFVNHGITQAISDLQQQINANYAQVPEERNAMKKELVNYVTDIEQRITSLISETLTSLGSRISDIELSVDQGQKQQIEIFAGGISTIAERLRSFREKERYL